MRKVLLMILDGWGEGKKDKSDVVYTADTKFMKSLQSNPEWKYSKLHASGEYVGLPDGQMGNSEVGHLNIGAGRVVYQDFVKINKAVADHSIGENEELKKAFLYARENNVAVHFIGLLGEGGVHSSTKHLKKLIEVGEDFGLNKQFIHVLTDGRDTDPYSGLGFLEDLEQFLQNKPAQIASVCGRYYTMDRDKRWERVKKGYDLLVNGVGEKFVSAKDAIQSSYDKQITDEFIEPSIIVDNNGKPKALIKENDVVICFNFRTDRLREITQVLNQEDMPEMDMKALDLYYVTMTRYDEKFKNVKVLFDKDDLSGTLGEIISNQGLKQIRIAETEKYPHVTFFFSGGREKEFIGEKRILISSPKVATYDLKPEMSAYEVKDAILPEIKTSSADFICLNFANADMVGHTGIYSAIKQAVEAVDKCVSEIVPEAIKSGYSIIIIADHGNADFAINEDGSPNTAHSLNTVPCMVYCNEVTNLKEEGRLSNIAPTILKMMHIEIPEIMDEPLY